jgi:hypothetical protein
VDKGAAIDDSPDHDEHDFSHDARYGHFSGNVHGGGISKILDQVTRAV